ncbi:hypothetical protein [Puniceibacterium confluentis]|uniref:hypothetical protein n=1 Tax=Puniceibacterium confluentis TaxID=1958944 RepID=UPI003563B07B
MHSTRLKFTGNPTITLDVLDGLLAAALRQDGDLPTRREYRSTGISLHGAELSVRADLELANDNRYLCLSLAAAEGTCLPRAQMHARFATLVEDFTAALPLELTAGARKARAATLRPVPRTPVVARVTRRRASDDSITPRRISRACVARLRETTAQPGPRRHHRLPSPALSVPVTASPGHAVARKLDSHVQAYERALRATLVRRALPDEMDALREETGIQPVEARLSAWAVSLAVATISLPIAMPVIIHNLVKGEDMRVASLSMGLAGFFVALESSGLMAGLMAYL